MGHLRKSQYSWVGEIRINGKHFGKTSKHREVVVAWLEEMRKAAKAAKEAKEARRTKTPKEPKPPKKPQGTGERTPKRPRAGSMWQLKCGFWGARIVRKGRSFTATVRTREEAEAWLAESKVRLDAESEPLPVPPLEKPPQKRAVSLNGRDYERISTACNEGREENIKKYAAMSAEAKVAAEAARVRRDAAAARIRELRALMGLSA